jgi:hypothetical protein
MTVLPLQVRAAQRASDSPGRSRTFRAGWASCGRKKEEGPYDFGPSYSPLVSLAHFSL